VGPVLMFCIGNLSLCFTVEQISIQVMLLARLFINLQWEKLNRRRLSHSFFVSGTCPDALCRHDTTLGTGTAEVKLFLAAGLPRRVGRVHRGLCGRRDHAIGPAPFRHQGSHACEGIQAAGSLKV
jgi:hypothetical protein